MQHFPFEGLKKTISQLATIGIVQWRKLGLAAEEGWDKECKYSWALGLDWCIVLLRVDVSLLTKSEIIRLWYNGKSSLIAVMEYILAIIGFVWDVQPDKSIQRQLGGFYQQLSVHKIRLMVWPRWIWSQGGKLICANFFSVKFNFGELWHE